MSHLIQALQAEGLEAVTTKYFIKTKRHEQYKNLVLFKYEQLNSPFENPVVQGSLQAISQSYELPIDARGIVLDENNGWAPVVFPYTKFFNFGESLAAKLDWSKPVKVTEKSDGSIMTVYCYNGYQSFFTY